MNGNIILPCNLEKGSKKEKNKMSYKKKIIIIKDKLCNQQMNK